jgi:hypothetical protein
MLRSLWAVWSKEDSRFNGHPPLGVNATHCRPVTTAVPDCFNGHPPLGVNATECRVRKQARLGFQWAPTLGGECYRSKNQLQPERFQWAPTLGGECYRISVNRNEMKCFNGHPPLGVNATGETSRETCVLPLFQWAPTLGGECYDRSDHDVLRTRFNGHPPLGVNATRTHRSSEAIPRYSVSMGTHPWG